MDSIRRCSVDDCNHPVRSRTWCSMHYTRWRRAGDPNVVQKVRRLGTCSIVGCDRKHYALSFCRRHWERNHINGDPIEGKVLTGATVRERLEHYSVRVNGCLEWTGHRDKNGYGNISVDGRTLRAHRVSYEEFIGKIPDGLVLRHKCDNPPCIAPEHLEPGTEADNSRDRVQRGRSLKWQENPSAHLTNLQVLEIYTRARSGETQRALATEFEVGGSTIFRIRHGLAWAGLTGHHANA